MVTAPKQDYYFLTKMYDQEKWWIGGIEKSEIVSTKILLNKRNYFLCSVDKYGNYGLQQFMIYFKISRKGRVQFLTHRNDMFLREYVNYSDLITVICTYRTNSCTAPINI